MHFKKKKVAQVTLPQLVPLPSTLSLITSLQLSSIASKGCLACFRHSNNSQTKPNQLWNITYKNSSVTIKKKPRLPAPKAPAILPLTALPALQVVESGVTSAAVPAGHVGQTLALPGHGVTAALLLHCPVGVAVTGYGRKTQTAKDEHHPRGALKLNDTNRVFQLVLSNTAATSH